MGKMHPPLRALVQYKRLVFVSVVVSAFGLLSFSPVSITPTTWHRALDFRPPVPDSVLPLSPNSSEPTISRTPEHKLVEGGRLKAVVGGRHPLYDLIAGAEAKWNDMVER
jgi:hypothetical protein